MHRYQIMEVWGVMTDRVKVGQIIAQDEFKGRRVKWDVAKDDTGEKVGGFTGVYVGQFKPAPQQEMAVSL